MKDLFENVLVDNIINFIKEINFYNQLYAFFFLVLHSPKLPWF